MISQDHSDVFVGVNESNHTGSPSCWGWNIEKSKNSHLEYDQPKEDNIYELYHFLDFLL